MPQIGIYLTPYGDAVGDGFPVPRRNLVTNCAEIAYYLFPFWGIEPQNGKGTGNPSPTLMYRNRAINCNLAFSLLVPVCEIDLIKVATSF